jgi:hypothetical protein
MAWASGWPKPHQRKLAKRQTTAASNDEAKNQRRALRARERENLPLTEEGNAWRCMEPSSKTKAPALSLRPMATFRSVDEMTREALQLIAAFSAPFTAPSGLRRKSLQGRSWQSLTSHGLRRTKICRRGKPVAAGCHARGMTRSIGLAMGVDLQFKHPFQHSTGKSVTAKSNRIDGRSLCRREGAGIRLRRTCGPETANRHSMYLSLSRILYFSVGFFVPCFRRGRVYFCRGRLGK